MDYFHDKTAIVTGGASGIGRAICEALGRQGARVVVSDIDLNGAEKVAEAVRAGGSPATAAGTDVAKRAEVMTLVEKIVSDHGRLDFMFNNAGITVVGETYNMTEQDWRRIMEVNLFGVIHGVEGAYPVMVKQGFGHIVNTASLAGLAPFPLSTIYSSTKHAVVALSLCLRMEAARLGVNVSVVCPGFVETNIPNAAEYRGVSKDMLMARAPRKWLPPERAARVILRGVEKNRSVIIFPFSARMAWIIARYFPWLMLKLGDRALHKFRESLTRL